MFTSSIVLTSLKKTDEYRWQSDTQKLLSTRFEYYITYMDKAMSRNVESEQFLKITTHCYDMFVSAQRNVSKTSFANGAAFQDHPCFSFESGRDARQTNNCELVTRFDV